MYKVDKDLNKKLIKGVKKMSEKKRELSKESKLAFERLKESKEGLTFAELKALIPSLNSSHLTALRNDGLITGEIIEREVMRPVKTKVNLWKVK
jgi:hypothetical protein